MQITKGNKVMISRQREYQIRQRELGNCITCGSPALPKRNKNNKYSRGLYCSIHRAVKLKREQEQRDKKYF